MAKGLKLGENKLGTAVHQRLLQEMILRWEATTILEEVMEIREEAMELLCHLQDKVYRNARQ